MPENYPPSILDSIVQITSPDLGNTRFGTGFILHKNATSTFVVSCAHVIQDVIHSNQLMVENHLASVIAIGDEKGLDLAVLQIQSHLPAPPLKTNAHIATEGTQFQTAGFQKYGNKLSLLPLRGELGKLSPLIYRGKSQRVDAWRLKILDDYGLQPGFSGCPVIDNDSGAVIAIVSDREGDGKKGLAISIEALETLWKDMTTVTEIPEGLKVAIEQNKCVFVIGPLLSTETGLPSRHEVLKPLAQKISLTKQLPLSRVAQIYENQTGRERLISHVYEKMDVSTVNPSNLHKLISQLPVSTIMTTNYDALIEEAFQQANKRYVSIYTSFTEAENISQETQITRVYKLCGDLQDTNSLIITQRDYQNLFNQENSITRILKGILAQKTLFFIGFDFEDYEFRSLHDFITYELGGYGLPAYAIMFDVDLPLIEDLKHSGITVINLGSGKFEPRSEQIYEILKTFTPRPKVTDGQISQSFRVEYEFVNPYLPHNKEALSQFLVTLKESNASKENEHIPTHLCLILDVSGSMNTPYKYPLLLEALPLLIKSLTDNDHLTIILFSSQPDLILSTSAREYHTLTRQVVSMIEGSRTKFGGATLMAPALQIALTQISSVAREFPNMVHRLYMLTDGELHDEDDCIRLNPELKKSGVEVYSYGFGENFTNTRLMDAIRDGCPGITTKPLFNTENVLDTFAHIGKLTQKIFGRAAHIEIKFDNHVLPGDSFRYRPSEYLGIIDENQQFFQYDLGTLEKGREYRFFIEARLYPRESGQQKVGTIQVSFKRDQKQYSIIEDILVSRTNQKALYSKQNETALEAYSVLNTLRNSDKESLINALRVRLKLYEREGRDPELLRRIKEALKDLEEGHTLSYEQERDISVATATQAYVDEDPRDYARTLLC